MSYDDIDVDFPLLQNIILQAEFEENEYDPELWEDFQVKSSQLRGNGIGHHIIYFSQPESYLHYSVNITKLKNYIFLSPRLSEYSKAKTISIPSGRYLVILGILTKNMDYSFNVPNRSFISETIFRVYYNNDIDLKIYTDINNDIKNSNVKERKIQSLENSKKEKYYDVGNETIEKKSLSELKNENILNYRRFT